MAITHIHPIKVTVEQAVQYCMQDKRVADVSVENIKNGVSYYIDNKTNETVFVTLTSYQNITDFQNPENTFKMLYKWFGDDNAEGDTVKQEDSVLAWHLVQSFEENIDPGLANEIGLELAGKIFPNHPAIVSTHTNNIERIHNHIVACAWSYEGGPKYENDHASYRKIRRESDALCDKHGLKVLEHTREQRLIKWTDKNGKVHYYEPTVRKNQIIRNRNEGKACKYDVNCYRNSDKYSYQKRKQETNRNIVKKAIDNALPKATTYDHLLIILRESGFKVRDRKKDGSWYSYITFTAPTADKGVRDASLDKDGYYCRENLEKIIEEKMVSRAKSERLIKEYNLEYIPYYEYNKTDISKIDRNYRVEKDSSGFYFVVERNAIEKEIVTIVKLDNQNLNKIRNTQPSKYYEDMLVKQIKAGFENLRFVETHNIVSTKQVYDTIKDLRGQIEGCYAELDKSKKYIKVLDDVLKLPEKIASLTVKIEDGKKDEIYLMEDYHHDISQLKKYKSQVNECDLDNLENIEFFREKIIYFKEQADKLNFAIENTERELSQYMKCANYFEGRNMQRIEKIREKYPQKKKQNNHER